MKGFEFEQTQGNTMNVVSLFNRTYDDIVTENDPMDILLREADLEGEEDFELFGSSKPSEETRLLVSENQFPDQSLYTLDEQLKKLRTSLNRIRFYLGDVDDLIPR